MGYLRGNEREIAFFIHSIMGKASGKVENYSSSGVNVSFTTVDDEQAFVFVPFGNIKFIQ